MTVSKTRILCLAGLVATALLAGCDSDRRSPMAPREPGRAATGARYPSATGRLLTPSYDVAGTPSTTVSGKKVLLYNADEGAAASLKSELVATGMFAAADISDITMTETPAALETLKAYDCVVVWTNYAPPSPAAQGDRLKEYVDDGGGVLLMTYGYSSPDSPWELQGGIMQDGYSPLDLTRTPQTFPPDRTLDFTTALTSHAFLSGVTEFTYGGNGNYVDVTLDPGATLIATDNLGKPLVAVNDRGNVGGINLYPGPVFTKTAGVYRTIANGCVSVASGTQLVPPNTPATVTVTENGKAVAGIDIPANGLGDGQPGGEDVLVSAHFVPAPCHDYLIGQFGKCVEITAKIASGPNAGQDAIVQSSDVVLGLCLDQDRDLELYKFEDPKDRPLALEQKAAPFLHCDGFQTSSAAPTNGLRGLAMGLARRVGQWLEPKSLWAAHVGFGGTPKVGVPLSFLTWATPIPISSAGLTVNVFNSGKDAFAVRGTFDLGAKDFAPALGEKGFDPARDAVTVGFGNRTHLIPVNSFKYSQFFKRYVYAGKETPTSGITAMEINPVDGSFVIAGVGPTEGALPTYRAFSLQIGHRAQADGLKCDVTRKCVTQEPPSP